MTKPFGLAGRQEKIVNDVSPNGQFTNSAVINQSEGRFSGGGLRDFLAEEPQEIDENTMFAEGSIGKIRFAGLAYMLQQEGIINLQRNALEFFTSRDFANFLQQKYPTRADELQTTIDNFFTNSPNGKLADLFTHRAGIGDLTRAGVRAVNEFGVEHEFDVPELILDGIERNPDLLDENGKPRAHRPIEMPIPDHKLPKSEHGKHEYSNLNYWLGALAMESAYFQSNPSQPSKNYKQLTKDFMLQPVEGRLFEINQENEKKGQEPLIFTSTKFPEEIRYEANEEGAKDNVVVAHWLERDATTGQEKIVNANLCSSANAAGGIFASASDSTKFFAEFFRGFPGIAEYGQEGENKFFTRQTITAMQTEWMKYPPANGNPQKDGFFRFQAPGFTVDYPWREGVDFNNPKQKEDFFAENKPFLYCKGGGTFGYNSWFEFNPKTSQALISIDAQENFTGKIAEKLAAEKGEVFVSENEMDVSKQRREMVENFIAENCASDGKFNRQIMIQNYWPSLLNPRLVDENMRLESKETFENKSGKREREIDDEKEDKSSVKKSRTEEGKEGHKIIGKFTDMIAQKEQKNQSQSQEGGGR